MVSYVSNVREIYMKIFKLIDGPVIPFICFILFTTQGAILSEGSIISLLVTIVLLAYVAVCAMRLHLYRNPWYVYLIDFLLLIYLAYFLFSEEPRTSIDKMRYEVQIKLVIMTLSPFFVFYYYSIRNRISVKVMTGLSIIYLIAMIPHFFYQEMLLLSQSWAINAGKSLGGVTNNVSYDFLHAVILIPLIRQKKYLSVPILIVIVAFLLLAAKRGAIIIFSLSLLIMIKDYIRMSKKSIFGFAAAILIIINLVPFFFPDLFSDDSYLMERFNHTLEGDSSNRDNLFRKIFDYCLINPTSVHNFFFGYGYNASVWISGNFAHNDWLELLSGFGLFGVIIYALFFKSLWTGYKKARCPEVKMAILLAIVILFMKSIFSMGFASSTMVYIYLGFLLGYERYVPKYTIRY